MSDDTRYSEIEFTRCVDGNGPLRADGGDVEDEAEWSNPGTRGASTVWVAWYGYSYEGDSLVGVYSTKEKAEAALGRTPAYCGDHRGVMPVTVDVDPEGNSRELEDHRGDDLRADGGHVGVNNGQLLQHFEEGTVVTYATDPACWHDEDVPTTRHKDVEVWVYDGWVVVDSEFGGETTVYPSQRVKEVFAR